MPPQQTLSDRLVDVEQTYFRKGFGLRQEIEGDLAAYHSRLVDRVRADGHRLAAGDLTFLLAKEFGFCYGVDRAVEYAYETRRKFPDRRVWLAGEIIHNPHVNAELEGRGIAILRPGPDGAFDYSDVRAEDVVLLPAFGVTVRDFSRLRETGCVLVDTTCGSVLNVWKRVERYAQDGFTAVVHGKHYHEETKATVSQVTRYAGGTYLVVRDMAEADVLCRFIERADNLDAMARTFDGRVPPGFDFARDLERIGVANQTTMLANESLAIARRVGEALGRRYGAENLEAHFRSFDTICSATQERQDAVVELIQQPLDVMIVIGGYNSSNTNHLAKICAARRRTYHVADASCIEPEAGRIRHKPPDASGEIAEDGWLGPDVHVIGITAGASTPNNKIGEAIERVLATRGVAISG
ncbi:MAG: 4-hydroxy-3-methylbut-2-enyl diphosphate reductase [Gemmatimonadetes bacterium]|nr:4-hydroxy-3-methylbut-2-enyl diphosphate reductase [Gemmatimonadota bacterium]